MEKTNATTRIYSGLNTPFRKLDADPTSSGEGRRVKPKHLDAGDEFIVDWSNGSGWTRYKIEETESNTTPFKFKKLEEGEYDGDFM